MRTQDLRRRACVVAVALLAVTLAGVGAFVYLALRSSLDSELTRRLTDRAAIARELAPSLGAQDLADRLTMDGTRVTVTAGGAVVRGTPPAPPAAPAGPGALDGARGVPAGTPPAPRVPPAEAAAAASAADVETASEAVTLTTTLPGGARLELVADRSDQRAALARLLGLEVAGSLIALALAAAGLWWVLGRALRPLDDMTAMALRIARGRSGERLDPARTDTELGRLARAFDEMLDAQEASLASSQASEERMRRFLADASHELRSPLAGVQATAEVLLRDGDERDRREALAVGLVRESRRAGRLVDDLVASTRVAGGLEVAREPVDVAALAAQAVEREQRLDAAVAVALDRPAAGVVVAADADRVAQVLAALLDNARRSAQSVVRVSVAPRGSGAGGARVVVEDDGPGVPEAERERVFERFVRLDDGRARSAGGSGLGLTIAAGLARAHGGTLRCEESATLGGAAFVLELPRGRAAG